MSTPLYLLQPPRNAHNADGHFMSIMGRYQTFCIIFFFLRFLIFSSPTSILNEIQVWLFSIFHQYKRVLITCSSNPIPPTAYAQQKLFFMNFCIFSCLVLLRELLQQFWGFFFLLSLEDFFFCWESSYSSFPPPRSSLACIKKGRALLTAEAWHKKKTENASRLHKKKPAPATPFHPQRMLRRNRSALCKLTVYEAFSY
jgi:hypothetical protein